MSKIIINPKPFNTITKNRHIHKQNRRSHTYTLWKNVQYRKLQSFAYFQFSAPNLF